MGQHITHTMKKLVFIALSMLLALPSAYSHDMDQVMKERKEISRMTKSELDARASKSARKEAKKYAREGWQVAPGQLPLEKQLDRTYRMQYEFDENMFPKYIMSEAMSVGESYDAAKLQAMELAKLNLAGQMQSQVVALIDNEVSNRQLPQEEAASVTKTVMASKNMIAQKLGRVITVIECYRVKAGKNKEVRVQIACTADMAMQSAKTAIREELEKEGEELSSQLDSMLGLQ